MPSQLTNMYRKAMRVLKNEQGQGLVEYALILVLIAIVVVASVTTLGKKVDNTFTNIGTKINQ